MPATTPNSPSKRKKINKMNKPELMEEVRYHRQKEEEYENLIKELKHNVKEIKDELNEIKSERGSTSARDDFETRLIQTERSRSSTTGVNVWTLLDFPKTSKVKNLKQPCSTFLKWPEYQWKNYDFHAIHRLRNTRVVIAKVCNRRDVIAILDNKKKLCELSQEGKKKLKSQKIYVNESLCPAYKRILGKCNALLKKKYVDAFYTINGKNKIKYGCRNGQETTQISHEKDLIEVFGIDIMRAVDEEHESKINPHN